MSDECLVHGVRWVVECVELLSKRVVCATKWLLENKETGNLKIAYFGSSTGASAALSAAADLNTIITALIITHSRKGRVIYPRGYMIRRSTVSTHYMKLVLITKTGWPWH